MGKQESAGTINWKEYRKKYEKKALEILKKLTLEEKISLMSGRLTREEIRSQILNRKKTHYNETPYWAGGIADQNVMPILFVDGSRGVVCGRGTYTAFPAVVLRGAAFDRELEKRIGQAVAEEVILAGGNLFGGVCLNLPYHPGWGRAQESYGADTYLIGEMGAALVSGLQSRGVIACLKHFALNSMENNRLTVNIVCDKRSEREVFLPQFKKCIDAGAGAVMTAYNHYQGTMCGHSSYLISQVLKKEWDFDGFVLSDFTWGINDTVEAANAGMDLEMPHTFCYGKALKKAVEEKRVSKEVVDNAALRIVRTMLAHGEFILAQREELKEQKNLMKKHALLALECAREGITLLKNRGNILPLKCGGKGRKIALLGYLAQEDNLGDHGSSRTYPPYVINSAEGIWKALSGAELIVYTGSSPAHCRRLAKEADAVIIIAGNDYRIEGEHIKADENSQMEMFGGDRTNSLELPEDQADMIRAVHEVRDDAVLVLTGGGTILIEKIQEMAGAVLMQYYPGMEGGRALGEILFGKISPSGRLPFCIPKTAQDLPLVDFDAKQQRYGQYHDYTKLDHDQKKACYDFGYGLSYTEFSYSNLRCWRKEDLVCASVTVKNIGKRESGHVVLLWIYPPGEEVSREKRLLKGFSRVFLKAGEEMEVTFECPLSELAYFDEKTDEMKVEKGTYRLRIGELDGFFLDK